MITMRDNLYSRAFLVKVQSGFQNFLPIHERNIKILVLSNVLHGWIFQ